MDIFVGRAKELETIDELLHNEKGAALVVGETGIGKSRLLAQVWYRYLPKADFLTVKHVCRFSDDELSPFVSLLADLVSLAVATQRRRRETEIRALADTGLALTQLGQTFGLGYHFIKRVLEEVSLKLGPLDIKLEKVFKIASETFCQMREMQPSLGLARQMLSEHAASFMERYAEIMEALRHDLPDRKLLIILDQVERSKKTTLDMLLDLAEVKPRGVYLMLAVNEEVLGTVRQTETSYQDLGYIETSVRRLDGHIVRLSGLTVEEIGDWVEMIHRRRLPDIELKRIRRATGGLPLLVEETLRHDPLALEHLQNLSKREYLDYCYEHRLKHLKHDTLDFAYRLSVLQEPLSVEDYPVLLELGGRQISLSEADYLQRQLEENLVFNNEGWFRHETIKDYLQKRMPPALCVQYHSFAAKFFEFRWKEPHGILDKDRLENASPDTVRAKTIILQLSQFYHLHCAGEGKQIFLTNQELFEEIMLGDGSGSDPLQNALERIADLERLYDYCQRVGDRLLEGMVMLGLGWSKAHQSGLYPSESVARTRLNTEAKQLYERALELVKSLPYKTLIAADCLSSLALIEWGYSNYNAAIRLAKESLDYRRAIYTRRPLDTPRQRYEAAGIADCLYILSEVEYGAGNIGAAARYCKRYLRLILKVKNAQLDWARSHKSSGTHHDAPTIIDSLYLLGQLYDACKENRKAVIIYSLLEKCYRDFKPYKEAKTTTERLDHLKGKVGQRRFKRYRDDTAELGFVPGKSWAVSVYRVLDIVNDTLL